MNTRNARLRAASLVGLVTLGGGVATMSSASASSTTTVAPGANLNSTDTTFIKSALVQPPAKGARVTGVARPDATTRLVYWSVPSNPGSDPSNQISYTQTYTITTTGYVATSTENVTATTATNTNVRTGPGVNYPIAATLKAGVNLGGQKSSRTVQDIDHKTLSSTTTGNWMKITSGPYAGKYINTAVMKNVASHGATASLDPTSGWALTSVGAIA